MQPYMAFMNVENSRSYIDDLYSADQEKCFVSIVCIKNSVIGSNRQKESVISQGIVPRLLQLLKDKNVKPEVRIEAAITLGSLAKGTEDHVELLLKSGTTQLLLDQLDEDNSRLIDACLCCLRTLSQHDKTPSSKYSLKRYIKLLGFAEQNASVQRQSCVATIIGAACKTVKDQNDLCQVGCPRIISSLLGVQNVHVRIPAITCLSAMCHKNPSVALEIAETNYKDMKVPQHLASLTCRYRPVTMQLEAAKCLTNLHRAGAIPANDPIILFKALPCLARIVQIDMPEPQRAEAALTMAYLTEVDCELQKVASISNQLVKALVDLISKESPAAREGAFRMFASLGSNDEDIRKRIIDTKCLMVKVMEGLEDPDRNVNLAAVICLHSLSRSVQQLRTTFQDHAVWRPLMNFIKGSNEIFKREEESYRRLFTGSPEMELLTAASSALCNLLLEFSPAKEPLLQQNVIDMLVELTARPEPSLRLNGIWALMNLAFHTDCKNRNQIMYALSMERIFAMLADADTKVVVKTLGLLRNLVSPRPQIDTTIKLYGPQILEGIMSVFNKQQEVEVLEQAICTLTNMADSERGRDLIMNHNLIPKKLLGFMAHESIHLQEGAVFCVTNLARKNELGSVKRQNRLRDLGLFQALQDMMTNSPPNGQGLFSRIRAAHTQFLLD